MGMEISIVIIEYSREGFQKLKIDFIQDLVNFIVGYIFNEYELGYLRDICIYY